jgi:hypothetical protein
MKKWVVLIFFISSTFLIFQHSTGLSWDFSVYVSGAKWFVGDEVYIELARPPLTSIIIASLGPFGWQAAEYLYIVVAVILSVGGSYILYRRRGLPFAFIPLLIINSYFLNTATSVGTEAMAMASLIMAIALFPKSISGAFFSMSFMSRYPMFIFAPIFLLLADIRKPKKWLTQIIAFGIVALITVAPWLLWNYIHTGDPLFSMVDSYTHNVTARSYLKIPPSIDHFLVVSNILTLLFAIGLVISMRKPSKLELIFLAVLFLNIFSYVNTPHKEPRYLFFVLLPVAYFSARTSELIGNKFTLLVTIVSLLIAALFFQSLTPLETFSGTLDFLEGKDCALYSNTWVFFDYYGIITPPIPPPNITESYLSEGRLFAIHKYVYEPDFVLDSEFIESHNILYNDSYFYIIGNESCYPSITPLAQSYRWMLASYGISCC